MNEHKSVVVPRHIHELKPYIAGKTIEEVAASFNLNRISKLASNENRLGCSKLALEAAVKSHERIMNYPDPVSTLLRNKLAQMYNIKPANVIAGSGSEGIMSLITRTFFLDHEEALTASATFIGFIVLANSRGIRLQQIPLTTDYRFDLPAIADAITPYTKIIYLANPNNPTGTYFTISEFETFMEKVPENVLVILDEAYFEFASDQTDYPDSMQYRFDNVITLRTFSKAYGLAGFRIGYGFAHENLIHNLMKVKLPFEPGTPAQAAGVAALDDQPFLQQTQRMVVAGRQRFYDVFDSTGIQYVKSYANSVMMVLNSENEAAGLSDFMLKEGVILRRLQAFGLPSCIRVTVGIDEEMNHFEEVLQKFVKAGS
jgi:histidinol-phosphate aminotransferase